MFEEKLAGAAVLLEPTLEKLLPHEGRLAEALRYAVLGSGRAQRGGKRFRPFLVFESAKLFSVPNEKVLNVAAAIECLHAYSLVHDDLPSMDNDDMRRGKPSVHKKFDEATAILAGDALQSLAFEIMAGESAELVRELARAAGWNGMAGGQQLDLDAHSDIEKMSAMKTGALIRFCVLSGAIVGNASAEATRALETYGETLGFAFQLSDDTLDAAKDAAAGKRTFVTTLGLSGVKQKLDSAVQEAIKALENFDSKADPLREAASFMRERTN